MNFTFTPPDLESSVGLGANGAAAEFQVTVCRELLPPGQACMSYEQHSQTFSFQKACGLDLVGIPLDIRYDDRGLPEDLARIDEGRGETGVWATIPLPEQGNRSRYRFINEPLITFDDISDKPGRNAVNVRLLARKDTYDPPPDHLYGWFQGACDFSPLDLCSGWSSAGIDKTSSAMGTDNEALFQRVYAHELTHQFFGAEHSPKPLDMIGWDVFDRIMTPYSLGHVKDKDANPNLRGLRIIHRTTQQTWVRAAASEYSGMFERLKSPCHTIAYKVFLPVGPWYMITGSDIPGSGWSLDPVFALNSRVVTEPSGGSGDLQLRLLDDHGNQLYSRSYDTVALSETTAIYLAAPAIAGTTTVELSQGGILQDSIARSTNAPLVEVVSPATGSSIGSVVTLAWDASDADGDPLVSIVQYSHDAGVHWQPVALNVTGGAVTFQTGNLPASTDGTLRVLVTDGLNTTSASVGGLIVGTNHPPKVTLRSPIGGTIFPLGANVSLVGSAWDLENDTVPNANMVWSSNLNGYLGSGPIVNTGSGVIPQLVTGTHTISLTVTDSQGAVTVKTAQIVVQ